MDETFTDPKWENATRLLSGLVSPERRKEMILRISGESPLVAARCKASSLDPEIELKDVIAADALRHIDSSDKFNKSNSAFLALVEIGEIGKAIERLQEVRIAGDRHVSVVREILSSDEARHSTEFFSSLREMKKQHRKLLLITVLALSPTLLSNERIQVEVERLGRKLIEHHYYTQLKSLVRKPGFHIERCLDCSVEKYVDYLVEDSTHLSGKYQRLNLALEIIDRYELSSRFPKSHIIEVILRNNHVKELPTRRQLLGTATSILSTDIDEGDIKKFINDLLAAPGFESFATAMQWIDQFNLRSNFDLSSLIRELMERPTPITQPGKVKEWIENLGLTERFPFYKLLDEKLEGRITRIERTRVFLEIPGIHIPCSINIKKSSERLADQYSVGRYLKATVTKINERGLELQLAKELPVL